MKYFLHTARIAVLLTLIAFILLPGITSAQIKKVSLGSDKVYGDFVVGPGKNELTVEPGTSKTIFITVANRMGVEREFTINVEDFTGSQDPTQPIVLLGSERGPYSLKDYVQINDKSFVLKHDERASIPVTISVPLDAEPGGKYGSVLVSTASIPGEESGGGIAPIISRVGSLIFLTVPGEAKEEGRLAEFSTKEDKTFYWKGPVDYSILYENTGNIYLNPYGKIEITNMFGSEVGEIEVKPWFALPNSVRLREASWGKSFLFGRYTATLSLNKGYNNEIDTEKVVFYVFPIKHVLVVCLGIFILVFIGYSLLSRFEIKRK